MADEKPKKSVGKKIGLGCLGGVLAFFALGVVGALLSPNDTSPATAATEASEEGAGPPIKVTAKELSAAYESNEAAAQSEFGKKTLQVSGTIQGIQLDFADKPFLVLVGTNQFMGPQAQLDKESQAKAASLSKGQKISLTCHDVSELAGTPMLDECHID